MKLQEKLYSPRVACLLPGSLVNNYHKNAALVYISKAWFRRKDLSVQAIDYWKKIKLCDPLIVIPIREDGSVSHAITIWRNYLLDSNCPTALPLDPFNLEQVIDSAFCGIDTAYKFERTFTKKKRKQSRRDQRRHQKKQKIGIST